MTEKPPKDLNPPSSSDPGPPISGADPWPLFPETEVSVPAPSGVPPASVGFFRRSMAFFMDLVLVAWITGGFTVIGLWGREVALGGGLSGILWADLDQWGSFHTASRILVFLAYFTFFSSCGGQTPGKMVYRFRVVMKNGEELPWVKSLIRTLAYSLGFLSLGLGFLAAAVLPSGRALHDFISGTRVEKNPSN